jgi:ABC-type antimicrobial peptide transport system permease subunit
VSFPSSVPSGYAAVVTDEFERTLMEGDALGRRFLLNGNEHTIVGAVLATFLYGVTPASPLALAIAVATITSAAGLAALGPALRAARIDPVEALRDR